MFVRIFNTCYETRLVDEEGFLESIKESLYNYLVENNQELDAEHWLESLEETKKIEKTSSDDSADIEITEEIVDEMVEEILEEIEENKEDVVEFEKEDELLYDEEDEDEDY